MTLKALIFDVDGTLAETEEAHRTAFNQAFADAGLGWHWSIDLYRELLGVTGGQQRIAYFLKLIGETRTVGVIRALHMTKNVFYAALVADSAVRLRPGVARLINEARNSDVRLAIATTTSRTNVDALLINLLAPDAPSWFDVIVTGEDVAAKKPDPEVYRRTLATLRLQGAACMAFEDSGNGLTAANRCAIPTVVTPSFFTAHEKFPGAALVTQNLDVPLLLDLAALNALSGEREGSVESR